MGINPAHKKISEEFEMKNLDLVEYHKEMGNCLMGVSFDGVGNRLILEIEGDKIGFKRISTVASSEDYINYSEIEYQLITQMRASLASRLCKTPPNPRPPDSPRKQY